MDEVVESAEESENGRELPKAKLKIRNAKSLLLKGLRRNSVSLLRFSKSRGQDSLPPSQARAEPTGQRACVAPSRRGAVLRDDCGPGCLANGQAGEATERSEAFRRSTTSAAASAASTRTHADARP
jgi:hypothetical protein